ncbi:MAG: DM13 domain-containing protein [Candidatus Eremiobacteraeota bacterium]|nr:DM13 domain-containing protein [Candidatus Eremiobacteraeota bacterium]
MQIIRRIASVIMLLAASAIPLTASAAPTAVQAGNFENGAHPTSGTATLYKLDDGKTVLRLTDFRTSNGPAVHVYLTAATSVNSNGDVTSGKFVDLGDLKANIGNQNYDIPSDIDLSQYHGVSIWCSRFSVNFGYAKLQAH